MVDAIDLMIGNILIWIENEEDPKLVKVIGLSPGEVTFEYQGKSISDFDLDPLSFNIDLLEALGFTGTMEKEMILRKKENGQGLVIILSGYSGGWFGKLHIDMNFDDGYKNQVSYNGELGYLHQLQNCYYLLTGEQLPVNKIFEKGLVRTGKE